MKLNFFYGIRFKLLAICITSVALAVFGIIFFQLFAAKQFGDAAQLEESYSVIYLAVFLILTTIFFYLFSKKTITRIEKISKGVDRIKAGNLQIHIPVDVHDEIGQLTANINLMAKNLQSSMEREHEAKQIKDEMISNISHDLRTPLTSLMGYIDLIKAHMHEDLEACEKYVDISQRKCEQLKIQINDLIEYCIVKDKNLTIHTEVVGVKVLIQQLMIDFIPQLEEARMRFEIKCESEVYIDVDVSLMKRLLQNMISNSIFYGKAGKKIMIHIRLKDSKAMIEIKNNGNQIAKEDIPYLFERFYRGEKSRNEHTGGKGMGLAIAKSIAELHKGTITVESDDKETVFLIALPAVKNIEK